VKLLLVAENWEPRVGGIERYLTGLTAALRSAGIEVDVIEPSRYRFFWPIVKPAWLPLFVQLYRQAKREQYDAVLCGKALCEGHIGYYLNKYLGIHYIVFTYATEIETWRQQARTRRALLRVLHGAGLVGYINEQTKQTLSQLGVTAAQLMHLPPGLPQEALEPVPKERVAAVREKYDIAERYILAVGRLIARKGFDILLSAFAALDQTKFGDVQLVIAGDGPEYDALDRQAENEMVATSVHLITDASDEDLAALYAGAQVFALTPRNLPGDFEGFGIVYLEAAARGVPQAGTRTGGVPEAVVDHETGLLAPPDDTAAVGDALARILSATALRERLGKAARTRAENEFLWEQRVVPLLRALGKLAD